MAGIIYCDNDTKWRYENAGTAEGLKVSGTTVTGLDSTKSKTGTAFWQTNRVSTFPIPATKELWVKFDLYYGNAQWRVYDRLNGNDTGFGLIDSTTTLVSYINGPLKLVPKPENTITKNQLHTFLLHMVSDSTNGIVELWVNGTKYYTDDYADEGLIYKGNVENGANFENLYLQSQNANCLFSNVIISNAPIGLGENVIGYGLTSSLDFDLKTEVTTSVELNCDLERNVKKIFRYENYGTADLLSISGTTVALEKAKSRYYSGFYQTQRVKCFDIPATKEIWIKFDVYFNGSQRWRAYNDPYGGSGALNGIASQTTSSSTGIISFFTNTTKSVYQAENAAKKNQLQTLLLHMVSDSTEGLVEVWSDGVKLGDCTGNVSNGADFDNIYLQSDGNGTYFSNVIISNDEIGLDENCKVPITVSFDIARSLGNLCEVLFDMERQVSNTAVDGGVVVDFDLIRNVSNRYVIDFDLQRDVNIFRYENYGTAELLSVTGTTVALEKSKSRYYSGFQATGARINYFGIPAAKEVWIKFDVYFNVKYQCLFFGSLDNEKTSQVRLNCCGTASDYHRIIFALSESVKNNQSNQLYAGALYRVLLHMKSDSTNGKIELFVSDGYNLSYTGNVNNGNDFENIYIQASNYNSISTYPYVSNVIISNAAVDINENCKVPVESQYDIIRSLTYSIEYYYDFVRNVSLIWQTTELFDIARKIVRSTIIDNNIIRDVWQIANFESNIERKVVRSVQEDIDIVRTMPHIINYSVVENPNEEPTSEYDTFGLESIEIQIAEQQLTDKINYTLANYDAEILDQFKGQYLDYEYDLRIEEMTKRGVLTTCFSQNNNDEMLYTQLDYKIPQNEQWHRVNNQSQVEEELPPMANASNHITKIANILNREPILQFDDFVSTVDVEAGGSTYNDIIRDLFGWTSRIPQMMINCYLRAGKIYVVQRGYEANVIDINQLEYAMPTIHKALVRTMWGSTPWSKTEVRSGYYWYLQPIQKQASSKNNKSSYTYDDSGLIQSTTTHGADSGSYTITNYYYETLKNGRKFLRTEETSVYENNIRVDYKVTEHTPLGQGQEHVSVRDEDGEDLGSVIGKSKGDDRVISTGFGKYEIVDVNYKEQRTLNGISLFDTSFPVHGEEKLVELTDAIKWLNLKTQESIDIDIHNYNHVIDFNDKILFNGNYYYLQNNTVIKNSRIVNKQSVSMVRWY